jgi:hypothetical protein
MARKEVPDMAKPKKLASRKPPERSRSDESLSLRSAESLGRVIGTLQRQLDSAIQRFAGHSTMHTPRLRRPEGAARPERNGTKRPRAMTNDDVPVRRAAKAAKSKTRATRTTTTSAVVKRASRPK